MVEEPFEIGDSTAYRKKEVTFPDGFWMGQTEVTARQFSRFVMKTGYVTDAEKEGHEEEVLESEQVLEELAGLRR